MHIKSFRQKDRYGNETAVEFFDVPEMQIPEYDHPGEPKGSDTVPAWLTPGEFVVNAEAVRMFEPQIEAMNEVGRDMQSEQGGTIPEGGTVPIPNDPVYAGEGNFISNLFKPQAPPGMELRKMKDGDWGMWAGNIYRGKYKEPKKKKKENTFSKFIGMNEGGEVPVYASEGLTGFLNKYILGPNAQIETEDDEDKKTSNVPPIALNIPTNTDDTLTSFLKAEEGLRNEAYLDSAGVPTIGYGSTYGVKMGDKLSDAEANQKLIKDMAVVDNDYSKLVDVELNPNQQAAVKSLLFNIGGPQFANSKARAALNAGDFETFQKEAAEFRMADGEVLPGLEARRAREALLFNKPFEGDFTMDESAPMPPKKMEEPPKEDEPFSIFGFQPFEDTRPDSVKAKNAEFNRKIAELNAEEVGNSFKQMETQRLINLQNGEDEFKGINKNTYNGLKDAVEFQKGEVNENTEIALDKGKVDPELATAALEATKAETSELGVPKPEEIAVANTPEYQDHVRRAAAAGVPPKSPSEFIEYHTPTNEAGQSPADRFALSKNSDEVSANEKAVAEAVTTAQAETESNKNQKEESDTSAAEDVIKQLGPVDKMTPEGEKSITDLLKSLDDGNADDDTKNKFEEIMGTAGEWFKGAFADMFSGPELARMAITYAGSRLMGYDHGGSLQYSMKNYIERVDAQVTARQAFITDEDNLDLYTKESLNAYRKSGNIEDLVEKNAGAAPTMVETSGQAYLAGYGRVEKFKDANGIEYVNLQGKNIPINQVASILEPWNESVHGREAVQKGFRESMESAASELNAAAGLYEGEDKDTRIKFDYVNLARQAEQRYSELLKQNGVSLRDAPELQIQISEAMKRFVSDTIEFNKDKKNRIKPRSMRAYINDEIRQTLTGIPNQFFTGASPSVTNVLDDRIASEVVDENGKKLSPKDPGYAEEYKNLWYASYAAFRLQNEYPEISKHNLSHWENLAAKSKDKKQQHTPFTKWMTSTPASEVAAIIEAANLDGNLDLIMQNM